MANPSRSTEYGECATCQDVTPHREGVCSVCGTTQRTQPKGTDEHGKPAEPMEIPVPKREDVEDALDRLIAAKPRTERD